MLGDWCLSHRDDNMRQVERCQGFYYVYFRPEANSVCKINAVQMKLPWAPNLKLSQQSGQECLVIPVDYDVGMEFMENELAQFKVAKQDASRLAMLTCIQYKIGYFLRPVIMVFMTQMLDDIRLLLTDTGFSQEQCFPMTCNVYCTTCCSYMTCILFSWSAIPMETHILGTCCTADMRRRSYPRKSSAML